MIVFTVIGLMFSAVFAYTFVKHFVIQLRLAKARRKYLHSLNKACTEVLDETDPVLSEVEQKLKANGFKFE